MTETESSFNKKEIYKLLATLVVTGNHKGILEKTDRIYAYNRMLSCMNLNGDIQPNFNSVGCDEEIADTLDKLIKLAVAESIIEDVFDYREILAAELVNCMMARPSDLNRQFSLQYQKSPQQATDWFYQYCIDVQYIQTRRINKNICYKTESEYGELDITINLSKPEKNPADIAAQRHISSSSYPLCLLCSENEGYKGRVGHPARANHRLISLPDLAGEQWYFQYSPYSYYREHCIVLSSEHRAMKIDRSTFIRLFAFLDRFPHYFIGSNADLPIVGGSILSHDHYQGGRYSFAMDKAGLESEFIIDKYPDIETGIVKWPMSVIRLKGRSSAEIIDCAEDIVEKWRNYSDEDVEILAASDGEPHNTVTPIARKRGEVFELDLVLRNNRCTEDHPMGLFHPHEDVHHIKKENIGLIEVMGLAVLPARLVKELDIVARRLTGENIDVDPIHQEWTDMLFKKHGLVESVSRAHQIVQDETAAKFKRVLEDAGVFKHNDRGRTAFSKFVNYLITSI